MSFWMIILIASTAFLFLLPLLLGIVEWLYPTDIAPLKVMNNYDNIPFYFAEGFERYINSQIKEIRCAQNSNGKLADGTEYQLVGEKGLPNLDFSNNVKQLLLSSHSITLPSDRIFEKEIYSQQTILAGDRSQFRSIMSGDRLQLREKSIVLRWAHSDGEMVIGRNSRVFGRITSKNSIILADGIEFERLYAPKIITASQQANSQQAKTPDKNNNDADAENSKTTKYHALETLSGAHNRHGRRWLMKNYFEFPAGCSFDGDIITASAAIIGDNSHIKGSIKCNAGNDPELKFSNQENKQHKQTAFFLQNGKVAESGCFIIGKNNRIDGSVVSSHDMIIDNNCLINGPVIAENLLIIKSGTIIGSEELPTTVTANRIIVEENCVIHGTLIAKQGGIIRCSSSSATEFSALEVA